MSASHDDHASRLPPEAVVRAQFADALRRAGLVLDGDAQHPIMDGKLHRVPVEGARAHTRDGAYVGHLDGKVPAGYIHNWKSGASENWTLPGVELSREELQALAKHAHVVRLQRAAERSASQEDTAKRSQARWDGLSDVPEGGSNAYLERKGVAGFGVKFDGPRMVIPLRDIDGRLWSLQTIDPNAEVDKKFAYRGRITGNMHLLGEPKAGEILLVAEGYATAATLHQATGKAVAVAFNSGNLEPVVAALKARFPESPLFILGDDDRLVREPVSNPGVSKALAAARKHEVGIGIPEFLRSGTQTDFNDLQASEGRDTVRAQVEQVIARSLAQSRADVETRFPDVVKQLLPAVPKEARRAALSAGESMSSTSDMDSKAVPSPARPHGSAPVTISELSDRAVDPARAAPASASDAVGPQAPGAQESGPTDAALRASIDHRALDTAAVPRDAVGRDTAQAWAGADLAAYRAIGSPTERAEAAYTLGYNALQQTSYRIELERQDPEAARVALRVFMDEGARQAAGMRMERGWQEFELAGLRERHHVANAIGLESLPRIAADTLARQDVLSLHALRGHPDEEGAKRLVRDAMRSPDYRQVFESETDRLQRGAPTPGRTVDLELPLVTDAQDALLRAGVERRSEELRTMPRDSLGTAAAQEVVAQDLQALRLSVTPRDRLAIAVMMGGNALQHATYTAQLERQDAEIGVAVVRAFQDSNRMHGESRSATETLNERREAWREPLMHRGTFATERDQQPPRDKSESRAVDNSISAGERDMRFDNQATDALRRRIARERAMLGASDSWLAETISRMTPKELNAYSQAPSAKEADELLGAVRRRVEAELDIRAGRPAFPPLDERFTVVAHLGGRRDYHFRDKPGIAFSEGWMSMTTASDGAAVVKGMLDRADERGWTTVRVNGSEEFKRQAWVQAEARGIRAVGYEPTQGDRVAASEQRAELERIRGAGAQRSAGGAATREPLLSPMPDASGPHVDRSGQSAARSESPSGTARAPSLDERAVLRAFEAAMDAKRVPQADRAELRETFRQELSARQERGERFGVRVYDPAAERQNARAPAAQDVPRAQAQTDSSTKVRRSPRPSH